ncbi:hypothetical protein PTKIN_Ptkin10aG0181500 [Pterospermum kingtungense]
MATTKKFASLFPLFSLIGFVSVFVLLSITRKLPFRLLQLIPDRWWAPSKFDPVKSPMLFFEKGLPMIPPIPPDVGLDKVLKYMIRFVKKTTRPGAIKLFRTQSPRHFEGGDWDPGGSCQRLQPLLPEQVEELFSLKNNGTNAARESTPIQGPKGV